MSGFLPMALAVALAGGAPVTGDLAEQAARLDLAAAQSETYGAYVADGKGRTLYMFTADRKGDGDTPAVSACYDACAQAWPPLLVKDTPRIGGNLDKGLVATIKRKDGRMQVTYGGWPLYYFVKDQDAGSVAGQDVHGFGGEWYLVSPDGSKNEREG